ncbi:hypothetical protein [Chondromyces apiculatus]|uniref:Uncharacterized protein n=1 Tax=Chondromyces apiculatus DSM 436 TaxID=1192034 RepID=A0A017TCE2_9BACT|nr:hypothetical protein [Chondromyces apiculatus]EYF06924.1 Hypothetical protein CAP_1182 [Chondromyces apiculatus DSM 436]
MDKISMTYFVDFVLKAGTPKLTGVREIKERKDELFTDFYRQVREAIVAMHRGNKSDRVLDDFLAAQTDERRRRIYPGIIAGYRKLLAGGKVTWFEPTVGTYRIGDLDINVNPELGLNIDGKPHLIKMYFRGESLSAKRLTVMLNLLTNGLEGIAPPGTVFAVLDVRKAKLHTFKVPNPRVSTLLRGEAASFATIYASM